MKIQGVAGCGKTTVYLWRALNALKNDGTRKILIIGYNLTLLNYLRDMLKHINNTWFNIERDLLERITLTNHHRFFLDNANNFNIHIDQSELNDFLIFSKYILKNCFF